MRNSEDIMKNKKQPPMLLSGIRTICTVFRVGAIRIKGWIKRGAPIYMGRDGSYRADYYELWEWYKQNEVG